MLPMFFFLQPTEYFRQRCSITTFKLVTFNFNFSYILRATRRMSNILAWVLTVAKLDKLTDTKSS